uniref:MOSC_N domain-containing protein n=1 Tax=Caenorhabditis tropicalis TaxID=1561998 RepID=A0A1I7TLA9_9PELO
MQNQGASESLSDAEFGYPPNVLRLSDVVFIATRDSSVQLKQLIWNPMNVPLIWNDLELWKPLSLTRQDAVSCTYLVVDGYGDALTSERLRNLDLYESATDSSRFQPKVSEDAGHVLDKVQ